MFVDGFIFNDELDLLELRLLELDEYVDRFVLVECDHSFSGAKKPLHYERNRHRFGKWDSKIVHIVAKFSEEEWEIPAIEWHQRRTIAEGFSDLDMTDYIMISDVDEIPNRTTVRDLVKRGPAHPVVLEQHLFYHYVNLKLKAMWRGPIIMPRGLGELDCQMIRDTRNSLPCIQDGGWHFSWLGSIEQLKYKLGCHTVAEDSARYGSNLPMVPTPVDDEHLESCLVNDTDLFGRLDEYAEKVFCPMDGGIKYPDNMSEWIYRHPNYARQDLGVAAV